VLRRWVLQLRIIHYASTSDWAAALESGRYEVSSRGVSLADEGFIHASTARQAEDVLRRYYADYDRDALLVLVLDVSELEASGSRVQWDDVPGQPDPFPHIYGPIMPEAAVAVLPIAGVTGDLQLPDLTGLDVAGSSP
jgi:uncharacterized protein (DUF952 family)